MLLLAFALVATQPHAFADRHRPTQSDRRRPRMVTATAVHPGLATRPHARGVTPPAMTVATWRSPTPPGHVDTSPDVRTAQNLTLSPAVCPRAPRAPPSTSLSLPPFCPFSFDSTICTTT